MSQQYSHTPRMVTAFITIPAVFATVAAFLALALLAWREIAVLPPARFRPAAFIQNAFPTQIGDVDVVPVAIWTFSISLGALILLVVASHVAEHVQDGKVAKRPGARVLEHVEPLSAGAGGGDLAHKTGRPLGVQPASGGKRVQDLAVRADLDN